MSRPSTASSQVAAAPSKRAAAGGTAAATSASSPLWDALEVPTLPAAPHNLAFEQCATPSARRGSIGLATLGLHSPHSNAISPCAHGRRMSRDVLLDASFPIGGGGGGSSSQATSPANYHNRRRSSLREVVDDTSDNGECELASAFEFMTHAPLTIIRQESYGVDEPMTAMVDESEDEASIERREDSIEDVNLHDAADSALLQAATGRVRAPHEHIQRSSAHWNRDVVTSQPQSRVFHSFLLMSLTGFFDMADLCTSFVPVCKQWRRQGHISLAHPSRRMQRYVAVDGGGPLLLELKRLTTRAEIKRRVEALSALAQASAYARRRVEQLATPATSCTPPPVTQVLGPSATLVQHLQFLPSNHATTSSQQRPLIARMKRLYRRYATSGAHLLSDADCLLVSTHLVHLRVLRIYDGSNITNEGIKLLSMQLKHLRILHIGHLSDEHIDDRALEYVSEGLSELHSLWLTQDTVIPVPTMWNPHPRILYNLFTATGLAKLTRLHRTLHHLNLGGFRNITSTGLRLVSVGTPRLHLQSLHLNGWHVTDECITLLHDAHCDTLYHLHLFDVGISNQSMATLGRMTELETLILDHVQEVDARGMEMMVDATIQLQQDHDQEQQERSRAVMADPALAPRANASSLIHLELHSCVHLLTPNGVLYLAMHPTLRTLEVSGPCSNGDSSSESRGTRRDWQHDELCRRTLIQVEELSGGRILCNGGVTPATRHRPMAYQHQSGSTASVPSSNQESSTVAARRTRECQIQ